MKELSAEIALQGLRAGAMDVLIASPFMFAGRSSAGNTPIIRPTK